MVVVPNWQLFVCDAIRKLPIETLTNLSVTNEDPEYVEMFTRVFSFSNDMLAPTEQVIKIAFQPDVLYFIKILHSNCQEFIAKATDNHWGWGSFPLADPEILEEIVGLLKTLDGEFVCRLHENGRRVNIIRSPNPDYIIESESEKVELKVVNWNVCPIDGKEHDFAPFEFRLFPVGQSPRIVAKNLQ